MTTMLFLVATKNNIVVMNTPLGNVQATAELTFSIIHACIIENVSSAVA